MHRYVHTHLHDSIDGCSLTFALLIRRWSQQEVPTRWRLQLCVAISFQPAGAQRPQQNPLQPPPPCDITAAAEQQCSQEVRALFVFCRTCLQLYNNINVMYYVCNRMYVISVLSYSILEHTTLYTIYVGSLNGSPLMQSRRFSPSVVTATATAGLRK